MDPVTPDAAERERPPPDDDRKALVKRWSKRIDEALNDNKDLHEAYEKRRKRVRGIKAASSLKAISNEERTNLVYATLAAILPNVYAKNPDISIAPSQSVDQSRYKVAKGFAATMGTVIERLFIREGQLKRRAKSAVRSAMTTSLGWVKVAYQRDVRKDPLIQNRMNDVQDNLKRLEATIARIEDGQNTQEVEAERESLKNQLAALTTEVEKTVSEGIVIDNALSEDILVLDKTVRSFDGYRQSSALAQRVWFTKEKYETAFGYKPTMKARVYDNTKDDGKAPNSKENGLYCAFEIWDKDSNTVFTLCVGEEDFCREPAQPSKLGEHWYPFFPLAFNLVDGQFTPMSDVELLEKLSDEYNETREQLKDARDDSIPVRIARAGGNLTLEDIKKLQNRKAREIVVLEGAGGKPLSEDLQDFPGVTTNPLLYDTAPIRNDLDVVSGSTDASRGSVLKAKTATEAEFLQQGLAGRTAERQDTIADWIEDMAWYVAEILIQELTVPQVQRIAGEKSQWPQMTKDDALELVNIEIRAGSMGKPNKAQEQEQWTKVMPVIQASFQQVMELRQQGMDDMADAVVELLRETLQRFDERIDVDSFIPPKKEEGQVDPAQEVQKLKQQLQIAVQKAEELQQVASEAQAKANDVMQKNQIVQETEIAKDRRETQAEANRAAEASQQLEIDREQGMAKIQAELDAATEKARILAEADIEKARIAAEYRAQAEVEKARMAAESAAMEPDEPAEQEPQDDAMAGVMEALQGLLQRLDGQEVLRIEQVKGSNGRLSSVKRFHKDGSMSEVAVKSAPMSQALSQLQ